jgi:GxxExxY protein
LDHQEHQGHQEPPAEVDALARKLIDAGLKVHRVLGPGLLESAYEHCLAHELTLRGVPVRRQVPLPIAYEGLRLDAGYRLDLVIADAIVVEVKAVDALSRLHEAQVLTYLKLSGFVSAS